ncbi:hypothetical protein QQX98_001816 [Neonectria punicea]|uniref:Transcriptional regulator n=1 Tax=Neonectria punicea TaxID=979145 RepID=A0ABR1HMM8_9HYPO
MTPSPEEIEQALLDGTSEVYNTTPDDTTVNKVRGHVEEKLGLEDGFLSTADWKTKSKVAIKGRVDQLLDGWTPDAKDESDTNAGTKRRSSEAVSSKPKRQKREPKPKAKPTPKKPAKKPAKKPTKKVESDLSELSELDDLNEEEKPQPKTTNQKKPTKKSESDLSELSELSDLSEEVKPRPKKKAKAAAGRKSKAADSDDEDHVVQSKQASPGPELKNEVEDDLEENGAKDGDDNADEPSPVKQQKASDKKPAVELGEETKDDVTVDSKVEDSQPAVVEEDEYSDVIDEPPKPKRKTKEKKEKKEKGKRQPSSKPVKATSKKISVPDDPQEAEIKKLQSYLIKCGIRKLWHNELKEYGDDSRAKIRHLKKMLSDAGMDGRFSEAKAREIKETRELMAEAEAAQEMNRLWGMSGRGRAMRSKAKTAKEDESEASEAEAKGNGDDGKGGDGADDDDDEEEEPVTYAARRRRAQAELAFLGDDSDSD